MRVQRIVTPLAVVFFSVSFAVAQVISIEKRDDKTVTCTHTGRMINVNYCGVHPWDTYVFIGSLSSITPIADEEKEIQIVPEEIFSGDPPNPVVVRTQQAWCLPKLDVGDRWLFFLRADGSQPVLLDYSGNDSRPVASAQEQIETLRRLQTIGDNAMLRGRVVRRRPADQQEAVPDAQVVAQRTSDGVQFSATAGADGSYEFQPIPSGHYTMTVDPTGSFHTDETRIDLKSGACIDVTLTRYPHAQLGGHVRNSDGSPAARTPVILVNDDDSWFATGKTDERGDFHFDSLQPGKYVVGINLPGKPEWKASGGAGPHVAPPASSYYPGTPIRSDAKVIRLAEDEKRNDIDFVILK